MLGASQHSQVSRNVDTGCLLNLALLLLIKENLRDWHSTAAEFDQANLLALTRFSGEDAVETGLRGAAGLTWTRIGNPDTGRGWDSTLTFGRVFRDTADLNFSDSSGLAATNSDWLIAGQLRTPSGLSLDTRVILDNGGTS